MNIIYCKGQGNKSPQPAIPPGRLVNTLANYLHKHLDGSWKPVVKKANECDVYVDVYFQIPSEVLDLYHIEDDRYRNLNTVELNLNITTYQNKIRVNTIEVTPDAKTLGFDLFPPEKLQDLNEALKLIKQKVEKRIVKEFGHYDFIF